MNKKTYRAIADVDATDGSFQAVECRSFWEGEGENPTNTIEETDFWSSVIKIAMQHWGNDIAGTKAIWVARLKKAEAALGSFGNQHARLRSMRRGPRSPCRANVPRQSSDAVSTRFRVRMAF